MGRSFLKFRRTWKQVDAEPLDGDGESFNEWFLIIREIASGSLDHTAKAVCYEQEIRCVSRREAARLETQVED